MSENLKKREGSLNNDVYTHAYKYHYTDDPYSNTQTGEGDFLTTVSNSEFVGWDTPQFHVRKRKGELLPMTPWKQFKVSGEATGGMDVWYTETGVSHHLYSVNNRPTLSGWVPTIDELIAEVPSSYDKYVQRAAAKIYSSGFDALTFVAELTDVHRLFSSSLKKLLKLNFPRNWKNLSFQQIRKNSKALSSEWLSLRYGWRSLLFDIKNIEELIENFNGEVERYSEVCGTQWSTEETTVTPYVGTYHGYEVQIRNKITTGVRGSVVADIEIPKLQFNLAQTAWEIVPLSFVVDWFLTVGKSISAASFLLFQSKYAAAKGYNIKYTRYCDRYVTDLYANTISASSFHTSSATAELTVRSPCRVSITPRLTLNLDPFKILDLLGLLIQRT